MNKSMQKITPFLWFEDQAEEAVNSYIPLFKNSGIDSIERYGPAKRNRKEQLSTPRSPWTARNLWPWTAGWKKMPKIVFSKTLEQVQGNARLVREDIAEEIKKLKSQPGKDIEVGGATIASTVIQLGLIDEYRLYVQPVVLGSGTSMFPALNDTFNLRLVETRTFGSGVVYLCYQRAGEGQ
jgi:dihydrofolate reductase